MGPAKDSQTIKKITIKGYEDRQQLQESPSPSKRRKTTDLGQKWSQDELMHSYKAYHRHGKDWKKISAPVGHKSSDMVKALHRMHQAESPSHRGNNQTVGASKKANKRGQARQQKVYEALHPHDSCHEGMIPGFSPSFKKRYYGELARNSQSHVVGNRTPRIPVIVPADRNATDDATPEIKKAISSAKKNNEEINNDCTNFPMNECSPNGRSGIMESTKSVQGQTFFETKGTGDAEICLTHQHLKKRRIELTMDGSRIGKVEHAAMMVAEEGNKPVSLLNQQQILSEFISEDDMLVLDVLQSLVNAPNKISKLRVNIPSGTLGKSDFALSHRKYEGCSPVDLSEQGKTVGECTSSKTRQKKHKKLLDTELPAGETNIAHTIDITEDPSNPDYSGGMTNLPESTANISAEVYPTLPSYIKCEISMSWRSKIKSKMHSKTKYVSCKEGSDNLQARKFLHCLSSESLRRWCTYEWFYSAVDYPWFMDNNEFVKYLNHLNLSHVSRLTRSEWNKIRSSLGKPRRFSDHFLAVEKENLEDYRGKVRKYYAQLSDGSLDSVPAGLAQPFSIGQQVIVRHPSSRELCDGKVVMVEWDSCKDTDCMPANWLDNLPYDVKSSSLSYNVHGIMEMEHIQTLSRSRDWGHTRNGVSISEMPESLQITSDEQLKAEYSVDNERPPKKSTLDDTVQSRGCPNNSVCHNDEQESYITAFVQSSQSQARQIFDEVMQAISEGNDSQDEEAGTWDQATNCIDPESGAAIRDDAQLPSNLIMNCTATVLAIKRLGDSRHPPANIAGVLEHMSSMLRPSCPENLAICKDIEKHFSIIKNQLLALVCKACC
ncbi:protein ALWAYS EARLY 3-like isoform X2 [Phragmites australis]|uniref:protein ALWAYS EARLY 3-like isoform X2 n=1 Tax=Phragmites australis TaxID=29695 RepID=UPI002D775E96|nr:protein ALWAYS EARLY 3-like isoform X2 [Phragmites australis]